VSAATALTRSPSGRPVRVVCLRSHAIPETPLIEANFAAAALKRLPTLAEVADTAAFVASDRAGAMTATIVNLSAGSIAD
jgi:3-oxoacyl-[acyl-carrier protein] reductase